MKLHLLMQPPLVPVTLADTSASAYKRQDGSVEVVGQLVSGTFFDLPRFFASALKNT